ncbi:MAG: hypothetical protein MI923_02150 [Phycisphaerales bacterium]|nr:hypothetical protein [Phycisphaerales bacterium]
MRKFWKSLSVFGLCAMLLAGTGADCESGGMNMDDMMMDGPSGDDGGDNSAFGAILNLIRIHVQGRIAVGDDVIVYTAADADGSETTVDYVVPSQGDTVGRGIPNAADYDPNSFAASGKKILLMGGPEGSHAVSVYDTSDGSLVNIPRADIFLSTIPVSNYGPGFLEVDGNLIATINQSGFAGATGDELIRVIDISGANPTVTKFTVNPDNNNTLTPTQALIDAETRTVVATRFIPNKFWVYDLDNPTAAPTEFDFSATGPTIITDDTPFACDNGMLVFIGRDGNQEFAYYLDVTDPNNVPVKIEGTDGGAFRPKLVGGRYAFVNNGPAANGVIPNAVAETGNGDGTTLTYGMLGATPVWIVGGQDNVNGGNPLQYSPGGGVWMDVPDPRDLTVTLLATDVTTDQSGTYLGFKFEDENDNQFLGYAILN